MSAVVKACLLNFLHGVKDAIVGLLSVPFIHRRIEKQRAEARTRLLDSIQTRERRNNQRLVNPLSCKLVCLISIFIFVSKYCL